MTGINKIIDGNHDYSETVSIGDNSLIISMLMKQTLTANNSIVN